MLLGVSPWYAVLFGFADALAGLLNYSQPIHSYGESLGVVGLALSYGFAAHILRSPLKVDPQLRRRTDVVKYVFVSMSGAAGATIVGTLCLVGDRTITWSEFYTSGLQWFVGDMVAVLGIAPFFLIHVVPYIRKRLLQSSPLVHVVLPQDSAHFEFSEVVETLGQAASLAAVVWVTFARTGDNFTFLYLLFIPIVWIAMRRGIRGVVFGTLALNSGIVIAMRFFPPTLDLFGKTGLFMMAVSATGLLVGCEVTERDRMALELNEQTTYLKSLIQSSPFGIIVLDRLGHVEVVNPAFQRLLLSAGRDLECPDIAPTSPWASSLVNSCELMPHVLEGQRVQRRVRQQRSDGTFLDLQVHAVPLAINNVVRGAYIICHDVSDQIRASETERSHSKSLSKLVSQLQLRAHELAMLNEMRDLFECCASSTEACNAVAESAQKLFPQSYSGGLYLIQSPTDVAEVAVRWGRAGASEAFLTADSCWCLRRGQAHWSEHSSRGLKCGHLMECTTGSSLCVPMMAQGRILGVLQLEFPLRIELIPHSESTESFRGSLQLLATSVAGQTAMALSSLSLRQKLQEQSIRDPLTELFNRRFMDESLETEIIRATRHSRPLSIMLIDIDDFKRFNDMYGHDAGDHVLESLADLLRTFFRACDICCRYGGEEFAIILPDSSLQNAGVRANALRTEVTRLNLSYHNQTLGSMTVSIGVAAFPEDGLRSEVLLKAADRCLYQSKASGRNAVTVGSMKRASSLPHTSSV
jgi:diguanylate cyclase (GGDEF)-like protein/PAS domain S-box-containing protein